MKPKILIVEDEFLIAADIKNILSDEGYHVLEIVNNVTQAKKAVNDYQPNLVLIDINLKSEEDGIGLGHYLMEKDSIPFVYLTSFSDRTTMDRVNETRPYGFIVKPYKDIDIITTVSVILNNNRYRNVDVKRIDKPIADDIPFIMKKVINYINENIYEKIAISDLIKITRWDSKHFTRLFTKYVGSTPYKYILDRKIEVSKSLLTETTINITQISFDLGFKSHSNYCSIFKKKTGMTPEYFRKWNEAKKYS